MASWAGWCAVHLGEPSSGESPVAAEAQAEARALARSWAARRAEFKVLPSSTGHIHVACVADGRDTSQALTLTALLVACLVWAGVNILSSVASS